MENPNYYAILPANVRYDRNLKPMEKILYSEITALANAKGYCYAKNQYFADLYEVHKNTVSTWINHLCELGYLKLEIIYTENTKEVKERRIYISNPPINENIDTYQEKDLYPINENIDTPINKKIEDNNININNTSNNIIEREEEGEEGEEEKEEVNPFSQTGAYYQEVRMLLSAYSINYESIARLGKPLNRIKEVLKFAKENKKGEGWIVGAIKDDYKLEVYSKGKVKEKTKTKIIDNSEYVDYSGDLFDKYFGKAEV